MRKYRLFSFLFIFLFTLGHVLSQYTFDKIMISDQIEKPVTLTLADPQKPPVK